MNLQDNVLVFLNWESRVNLLDTVSVEQVVESSTSYSKAKEEHFGHYNSEGE